MVPLLKGASQVSNLHSSRVGELADWLFTDIAFKDSQTLWAQHSSGVFSQFDVRDARAPLDAVPRVAATWEVTGSLTFVADKPSMTELPYDDR